MIKYLKTRKGHFYKLLKNGKKKRISQREYQKMKTRKKKINMRGGGFTELGINDSETIVREKLNNAFGNPDKFYKFVDKKENEEKIVLIIDNTIKVLKESKSWKEVNHSTIFPRMRLDAVLVELFNENEIKEINNEINSPPLTLAPPKASAPPLASAPPKASAPPSVSAPPLASQQVSSVSKGKSTLELIKSNIKSTEDKVLEKGYKINRIEITMENRDAKILEINNRLNELCGTLGRIYLYLTKLARKINNDFKDYA